MRIPNDRQQDVVYTRIKGDGRRAIADWFNRRPAKHKACKVCGCAISARTVGPAVHHHCLKLLQRQREQAEREREVKQRVIENLNVSVVT